MVREGHFELGKMDILMKSQGKLAELIPLKAGRDICGRCDFNSFSLLLKETLLNTLNRCY